MIYKILLEGDIVYAYIWDKVRPCKVLAEARGAGLVYVRPLSSRLPLDHADTEILRPEEIVAVRYRRKL